MCATACVDSNILIVRYPLKRGPRVHYISMAHACLLGHASNLMMDLLLFGKDLIC